MKIFCQQVVRMGEEAKHRLVMLLAYLLGLLKFKKLSLYEKNTINLKFLVLQRARELGGVTYGLERITHIKIVWTKAIYK